MSLLPTTGYVPVGAAPVAAPVESWTDRMARGQRNFPHLKGLELHRAMMQQNAAARRTVAAPPPPAVADRPAPAPPAVDARPAAGGAGAKHTQPYGWYSVPTRHGGRALGYRMTPQEQLYKSLLELTSNPRLAAKRLYMFRHLGINYIRRRKEKIG